MNIFYPFILFLTSFSLQNTSSTSYFKTEPIVRVRLLYTVDSFELKTTGSTLLISSNDSVSVESNSLIVRKKDSIIQVFDGNKELISSSNLYIACDSSFIISDVPYAVGWWWSGKESRTYNDLIQVYINEEQHLDAVLHIALEDYVKGVIPYEIGVDSPLEALKSQAVAARTEIVKALITNKYSGEFYDICADVECQVYAGNNKRTSRTDSAVTLTKAQILEYDNEVIDAYFASSCGGKSERVEKVWPWRGGPKPYLISQYDSDSEIKINPQTQISDWLNSNPNVYCNPNIYNDLPSWSKNNFRWKKEVKLVDIDSISILERGESGRIHSLLTWNNGKTDTLSYELAVRKMSNPPLKSSAFIYHKTDSTWIFEGAGWGHGVGMCQTGAVSRANRGQNYKQILSHYFPKTELKSAF